jgi:hypothetical protein
MLMTLPAAVREQRAGCVFPLENRCAHSAQHALRTLSRGRIADLQRENGLALGEKKQHFPMKKRLFPLDAHHFSLSIRSASESAVFRW